MASSKQVVDSPVGWVAKHIQEYEESNGAKGHKWRGQTTLLLTTRGRKSGKLRRTASAKEKPRLWKVMSRLFPQYDKYQQKANREIPLVIVERVS
jgi:hypothetical protein